MKKKYLFTITMLLSLFCACNDSESWINEGSEKFLSVAEVGFSLKSSDGTSKSFFEEGDEIGLHINSPQGTGYNKLNYKNSSWVLQTPVSLAENNTDIYATYPYDLQNNVATSFEIEHTSQTDYLYSERHSVNSSNPVLSLTMKHALALIEFEFEWMDVSQAAKLDFISIQGQGLYSRAKLDLITGRMEHLEGWNDPAIIYGWQLNSDHFYDGSKVSLMVVPVDQVECDGDILVDFYTDNLKAHWPVPAGTKWESGKKYSYKVLVQERLLEILDVRIEDWIDAGTDGISLPWYE
ncbi:fimbrillin family protein [Dysgonomonas termitidis]|uniref:Fimbrillin family protein n=1 Tax=Dysgonomonas termitidis TaxID=1516126 RepID=A0ABV9KYV5_9BACT